MGRAADGDADRSRLRSIRHRLLNRARRLVQCPGEAEDLVQDALLAAHEAGRLRKREGCPEGDLREAPAVPWLLGVLWRRAAFVDRTASRRRARERDYADLIAVPSSSGESPAHLPPALPPSVRLVAQLAAAGCSRDEIRWLLSLRPAALRQRIAEARRRLSGTDAPAVPSSSIPPGPRRAAVLPSSRLTGALGSHDPVGHLILLDCSRSGRPRQP